MLDVSKSVAAMADTSHDPSSRYNATYWPTDQVRLILIQYNNTIKLSTAVTLYGDYIGSRELLHDDDDDDDDGDWTADLRIGGVGYSCENQASQHNVLN